MSQFDLGRHCSLGAGFSAEAGSRLLGRWLGGLALGQGCDLADAALAQPLLALCGLPYSLQLSALVLVAPFNKQN